MILKVIVLVLAIDTAASECPLVSVGQGVLKGKEMTTVGRNMLYFAYLGIPYAKPPVGELRYKAPQPPDDWKDILYVTEEGSKCTQALNDTLFADGSEDCLYLNVYTGMVPDSYSLRNDLRPVMVWIHGGSFCYGSGSRQRFGPDYLLEENVVVVTVNYRLGALGFLNLQDSEIPGNMGLKDQVAALKWVQRNINAFGGDPDKVTLFGQSAGAASVHLHLLSPRTEGLFHRAIVQSGSAYSPWAFNYDPLSKTESFIELVGCHSPVHEDTIRCLRKISVDDIIYHQESIMNEKVLLFGQLPFSPSVEIQTKYADGHLAYLTSTPDQMITKGHVHHVPLITGLTSHEGLFTLEGYYNLSTIVNHLDFQEFIPEYLKIHVNTSESYNIANLIYIKYFGRKVIEEADVGKFVDLMSDVVIANAVIKTVRRHAFYNREPIFFYKLSFDGELGFYKREKGLRNISGVCHSDDLGYLFHAQNANYSLKGNPPDEFIVRDQMVLMWTNFAKTGNPTPSDSPPLGVIWLPFSLDEMNYLDIGVNLTVHTRIFQDRVAFWDFLDSTLFAHTLDTLN